MKKTGFWVIPEEISTKTPLSIMKEQAAALTDATDGQLIGDINSSLVKGSDLTNIFFSIIVPSMSNYTYVLMRYRQPVLLYPGALYDLTEEGVYEIGDEEDFLEAIKTIIQSEGVNRVIVSLLSQVRSQET